MDVAAWLQDLGLGQYGSRFHENEIEADVLPERRCLPAISSGQRSKLIEHHKAGAIIDYPLEVDGVKFYADAEEVLTNGPSRA
jgi:hypothetical protein